MLAWILEHAGLEPGFLIGGVPANFGVSARGSAARSIFVIEADEYDTAFFDKRAKFVHYRPRTADPQQPRVRSRRHLRGRRRDPEAVPSPRAHRARQRPHRLRTAATRTSKRRSRMGAGRRVESFRAHARQRHRLVARSSASGATSPSSCVRERGRLGGTVRWALLGGHNVENALAAIARRAARRRAGRESLAALGEFKGVKRRHGDARRGRRHRACTKISRITRPRSRPRSTACAAASATARIVAVLEPRSNTMRMGVHRDTLAAVVRRRGPVFVFAPPRPRLGRGCCARAARRARPRSRRPSTTLLRELLVELRAGDHVVLMSNGGFQGLPARLQQALASRA